jgi:alpha-tubulin suppressor-like RCC1 family protein
LLLNNTIKCWGNNSKGQLFTRHTGEHIGDEPGEMGAALVTVNLGGSVVQVATGIHHTCVMLDNGLVECWGSNEWGQTGRSDDFYSPDTGGGLAVFNYPTWGIKKIELGWHSGAMHAKAITAGKYHTCALLLTGDIKCWGRREQGQTGSEPLNTDPTTIGKWYPECRETSRDCDLEKLQPVDLGAHKAIAVSAGGYHTCAILDNGAVKCWGDNLSGQLGLGDTEARDTPEEMGENLPAVNLGRGRTAKAIEAGFEASTCALLDNMTVKCWGYNGYGTLGQGDKVNRGDDADEMGDRLAAINLGTGKLAKAISLGYSNACAILNDNTVKCWGRNTSGQLGLGDKAHRGDSPGEMGDFLPNVALGSNFVPSSLSSHGYHTCARATNGRVKCWGANGEGQLGQGDARNRGDEGGEMGDFLASINLGTGVSATAISAGQYHTCALLANRALKCWGWNRFHQTAQANSQNSLGDSGEMGDALLPVATPGIRYDWTEVQR